MRSKLLALSCLLALLAATSGGGNTSVLAQNVDGDSIVKFCKDNLGKKVGDGECFALGAEALKAVGAKTGFKDSPKEGDHVWGKLVYALEIKNGSRQEKKVPKLSVAPGDIIQLRDVEFKGANYSLDYPHHTAVIVAIKGKGKTSEWVVLEQNFNGQRFVTENSYFPNDLKKGGVRVYRPVAK